VQRLNLFIKQINRAEGQLLQVGFQVEQVEVVDKLLEQEPLQLVVEVEEIDQEQLIVVVEAVEIQEPAVQESLS
jgi:hypothetical protein